MLKEQTRSRNSTVSNIGKQHCKNFRQPPPSDGASVCVIVDMMT